MRDMRTFLKCAKNAAVSDNSCYCLRHLKNVYDGDDDIEKL